MLSERIRRDWPATRTSRDYRARNTALSWNGPRKPPGTKCRKNRRGGKNAPQPVWEATEVITRERGGGGGGGEGYPTRNRAGDAQAAHRTLITWVSRNNYEWESDRGAFKNRRKCNWRGRKRRLQFGTKTKRLTKRPGTPCHRKAGTDGNATSSWMSDWRANTLGSTRRANNLRKTRGAPR